jgi:trehalose 6-phosphate phosphatase
MNQDQLPRALESTEQMRMCIAGRLLGFFLDFDGTLAPIQSRPDLVTLPPRARLVLEELSGSHLVCILSGRDLDDLRGRAALPSLFYGGDHGYRVSGPPGSGVECEVGSAARGTLATAAADLRGLLDRTEGVIVEEKGLSLSVHYRLTPAAAVPEVQDAVREVRNRYPSLRQTEGKLAFELHPGEEWDKGRAMNWLIQRLGHARADLCPICLGDDLTDEDMFRAAKDWGISVAVGRSHGPTCADYRLKDTDEVIEFLAAFASRQRL